MAVYINVDSKVEMEKHAREAFPNECVGFFFGTYNEKSKKVIEIKPIQNSKVGDQRRRFEIDPLDYLKAEQYALESSLALLGIYHSHPLHPAIPSEHDRIQALPVFSYIILSLNEAMILDTTSWVLNDSQDFERETLKIEEKEHLIK